MTYESHGGRYDHWKLSYKSQGDEFVPDYSSCGSQLWYAFNQPASLAVQCVLKSFGDKKNVK